MLHTNTDTAAYRACLAGVSRAHELDPDAGGQGVTGVGKLLLQQGQLFFMPGRGRQFYTDGARHSTSSLDMLGTFDVTTDRLGAHIAGCAHVLGRRPQVAAQQGLLQIGKGHKELSGGGTLQHLHDVGHGISRRDGHKQVDMVRLKFKGKNIPAMFDAHLLQHGLKGARNFTGKDRLPIFRAPHHMVGCLVDTISAVDSFNHSHILSDNMSRTSVSPD
jgi:hypothetical protein